MIAALNQVGIATTVTQPVLIAVLATVAGILIVGVGGGLVRPMQQRWDALAGPGGTGVRGDPRAGAGLPGGEGGRQERRRVDEAASRGRASSTAERPGTAERRRRCHACRRRAAFRRVGRSASSAGRARSPRSRSRRRAAAPSGASRGSGPPGDIHPCSSRTATHRGASGPGDPRAEVSGVRTAGRCVPAPAAGAIAGAGARGARRLPASRRCRRGDGQSGERAGPRRVDGGTGRPTRWRTTDAGDQAAGAVSLRPGRGSLGCAADCPGRWPPGGACASSARITTGDHHRHDDAEQPRSRRAARRADERRLGGEAQEARARRSGAGAQ